MSDDETPIKQNSCVEVSCGWNSSSPRPVFQFPESPEETHLSQSRSEDQADGDTSRSDAFTMQGILGKYTALLPESSPPRPKHVFRKRKPESPLIRRNQDQLLSPVLGPALVPPAPPELENKRPAIKNTVIPPSHLASNSDSDSDSDFEAFIKATAPVRFPTSFFNNREIRRFVVQSVDQNSLGSNQLDVSCTDLNGTKCLIKFCGSWSTSKVSRGDTIHLFSQSQSKSLLLNDENDVIAIINPDILISCTSIAESLSCERQVILKGQIRAPSDLNANLVLGSIKHEFLQACFMNNLLRDAGQMQEALKQAAELYSLDLQLVDLDVETAVEQLKPTIPTLQRWAIQIWGSNAPGQVVSSHRGNTKMNVRLNRSIMVEEEVRSPYLGLVGKIDVTAETTVSQTTTRLAALEIKTGRSTQNVGHRAQASLYTLLLSERHPNNTHPFSLLYYTVNSTVLAVHTLVTELRHLFQKRNMIAYDMWQAPPSTLPVPKMASESSCRFCSRKESCVVYTAINEPETATEPLAANYQLALSEGKISPTFIKFVERWNHLIELEHNVSTRYSRLKDRQWWVKDVEPPLWSPVELLSSENGFTYSMTMTVTQASPSNLPSFSPDERVIVSTKQHMGVSFGVAIESSGNSIKLWSKEKLFMSGKYRIDGDPWVSDMHLGLARFNLISLMDNDRLRELVVDLVEPLFTTLSEQKFKSTLEWASSKVLSAPKKLNFLSSSDDDDDDDDDGGIDHYNLNEDQTLALNKVLCARDYALILGMPGTGKTTTIAAIVASLVKRGKSVLVTAYTNSAVDTLVLKLISSKVPCLRLASSMKDVHKDVIPVLASTSGSGNKPMTEFLKTPVIACTSHMTGNKIFALREFDYCILDEASQITLPFCLGPLRLASKFALVGDHYQLPPLVRNQTAKESGLADSLFKILCEAHPNSMVELTKQYRMCRDIMSLSSDLVYNGKLVCGSESVARQKLYLSNLSAVKGPNAIAVDPENRVVFLDTDYLGETAYEMVHSQGLTNNSEAVIIQGLISQLSIAGLNMRDVAVISVYRKQLVHITELLQKQVEQGLEILTADQAQGRDKRCIVVSLVRSNEKTESGELLKDWRRLNVAFTRAKEKLIIVGSKKVMQHADGVAKFFDYINEKGWVHPAGLP